MANVHVKNSGIDGCCNDKVSEIRSLRYGKLFVDTQPSHLQVFSVKGPVNATAYKDILDNCALIQPLVTV